jgi:hypothetical protein
MLDANWLLYPAQLTDCATNATATSFGAHFHGS